MRTIDLGGFEIAYAEKGQGPAVLFLHAFPLNLAMWDGLDVLAGRHRIVRFDARGFGGSEPGDAMLTMDRIADDAALLIEKLRLGPVVLAGCSMGGYAAFAFVRRHPSLLRGLILSNTRTSSDTPEARKGRGDLAARVMKEGARAALDFFLPRIVGETTKSARADVVAKVKDLILATSPQGISDGLYGLAARPDSASTLREISVPTLVVVGEEDGITPVADAETMQRGIKGAELAVIPKSGHLSAMETPAEFSLVVAKFLARF